MSAEQNHWGEPLCFYEHFPEGLIPRPLGTTHAFQDSYGRPLFYEAKHAPVGGVDVQGTHYPGGQFIPAEVIAHATPQEKKKIDGSPQDESGKPLKKGKKKHARTPIGKLRSMADILYDPAVEDRGIKEQLLDHAREQDRAHMETEEPRKLIWLALQNLSDDEWRKVAANYGMRGLPFTNHNRNILADHMAEVDAFRAKMTTEREAAKPKRAKKEANAQDESGKPLKQPKKTVQQIHQELMSAPFEVSKGLSPAGAQLERYTQEFARANYPTLRDQYLFGDPTGERDLPANATVDPQTGQIKSITLNTDEFRALLPGYVGTNAAEVHEAASWLNKMLYTEALEGMKGKGNGKLMILAGGGGSGKGTAVGDHFVQSDYPIVLDQVSDNLKKLETKMGEADDNGYETEYVFIDRHPEGALGGIVGRALRLREKGKIARTVPLEAGLHANIKARRVALDLLRKDPNAKPNIIDNTGRGQYDQGGARRLITDRDAAIAYLEERLEEDEKTIEAGLGEQLKQDIIRRHQAGQIATDLAQGFLGPSWTPPPVSDTDYLFNELQTKGAVQVQTPDGRKFTIQQKKYAGAKGYGIIPEGKKRAIKGGHRIMSDDDLRNWLDSLKRVTSNYSRLATPVFSRSVRAAGPSPWVQAPYQYRLGHPG